jgi:hypothetical protein
MLRREAEIAITAGGENKEKTCSLAVRTCRTTEPHNFYSSLPSSPCCVKIHAVSTSVADFLPIASTATTFNSFPEGIS